VWIIVVQAENTVKPDLIWLEAIPLSDIAVKRKDGDQCGYYTDWSRATVRVGNRVPSRAVRALIAACNSAYLNKVTPSEALERLTVLRTLEHPA
jgi:hypothetical protein